MGLGTGRWEGDTAQLCITHSRSYGTELIIDETETKRCLQPERGRQRDGLSTAGPRPI